MSRTLILTEEARRDIAEASQWYEEREPGTGSKFVLAVDDAFERILRDPEFFRIRGREGVRLCRTDPWPYGIYFRLSGARCEIVAVVHAARDPKYLNYRLR